METYEEINYWEYLDVLKSKGIFIISFVICSVFLGFLFSKFMLPKTYVSEVWIKNNNEFVFNGSKLSQESLKTYFMYPEIVIKSGINEDGFISERNFKLESLDNDIFHITYTHEENSAIADMLDQWLLATKEKLILEAVNDLLSAVKNESNGIKIAFELQQKNIILLKELMAKEGKYVEVEVVPKDSFPVEVIVFKDLNPNYVSLSQNVNSIEQKLNELENKREIIQGFLTNLISFNDDLQRLNTDEEVFSQLDEEYTVYLQQIEGVNNRGSLVPFYVISGPYMNPNPISLSVKQIMLIFGLSGFFVISVLVIFNYERQKYVDNLDA